MVYAGQWPKLFGWIGGLPFSASPQGLDRFRNVKREPFVAHLHGLAQVSQSNAAQGPLRLRAPFHQSARSWEYGWLTHWGMPHRVEDWLQGVLCGTLRPLYGLHWLTCLPPFFFLWLAKRSLEYMQPLSLVVWVGRVMCMCAFVCVATGLSSHGEGPRRRHVCPSAGCFP